MSYLYVCAQNGIDIVLSSDQAEATLEVLENGSGRFIEVRLFQVIIIQIKLPKYTTKKQTNSALLLTLVIFPYFIKQVVRQSSIHKK
jgi:hypothetical protein